MTLSTSDAVRLQNNTAIVKIMDDDDGEKAHSMLFYNACCFPLFIQSSCFKSSYTIATYVYEF